MHFRWDFITIESGLLVGDRKMEQDEIIAKSIDQISDIILACDCTGKITYCNATARELLEYPKGVTVAIDDVFPGVFFMENEQLHSKKSHEKDLEVEIYRYNRTCFPVSVRLIDIENQGYICIAKDRTKEIFLTRKIDQVGEEAKAAAKVKSEFVANITHELRTPVNGILGNILSLKELEQDPKKLQIVSLVERGCADMNAIINNILDFSKLEAGKFTLEQREFDFRAMMEYVKANHKNKIAEKGLQFTMSISPEIPKTIIGDELRIVQILNNLLSNACKFTTVGSIAIEVVKTAQINNRMELFFLVIDTGIGISKENQDKLFQSFSQVDASISRRYGGTGLGLNICKQLVELMNGSIHVESAQGKGSMFSFQIWVEIPEQEMATSNTSVQSQNMTHSLLEFTAGTGADLIREYGTKENGEELKRDLNKLILSVEMGNWEKAEEFAKMVRELTMGAPQEIKNDILRLKMAVQKQNYDMVDMHYKALKDRLKSI